MILRNATVYDYPAILKLNEAMVEYLSPMDEALLSRLHEQSELIQVVEEKGKVVAFIIVLREGKDYDSENYLWFSRHFPTLLYMDRIVVHGDYHHHGYGKILYHDVFTHAKHTNVPVVTAEVNIQPPNPVSLNFHKNIGFKEVGTQWIQGGKKQVSLLAAQIKE